ncbi:P-loop containing nucleoside triphosphate hydrolase protein [Cyathus striatus]|nr:P-loop containing nucleoside triphosphate hydrolase protein [Cyathus striatus]
MTTLLANIAVELHSLELDKRLQMIYLWNVSLIYPGTEFLALKDVSLSIKPGELVVVVGSNGSGKSTLMKVISRLLTNYAGVFMIDGQYCHEYRKQDLDDCTALLSQNSPLYPVSIAENIGLGLPEQYDNTRLVEEAAKRGGAYDDKEDPLREVLQGLRQETELSGGERQRLLSARLFMRLFSENINFVGVDEPSSELDAVGERDLFENLIVYKGKRTMVIVAHHFYGLVERANKIICMKEGSIAEIGSHSDLMRLDGVYSELYKAQTRSVKPTVESPDTQDRILETDILS